MSNSSSDSFQLIKEDQNEIILKKSSPPISNYSDGYQKSVSNLNLDQVLENHQEQKGGGSGSRSRRNNGRLDQEQEIKKSGGVNDQEIITAKTELGKSEVAEDDEGFKTPTSLDQRIPVIPRKCPPAPRKPRPPSPPQSSRKRKISRRRNVVKLDFTREIELLFPSIIRDDLNKKMKKSRKSDDEEEEK